MGFEPTRGDPIGVAGQRLSHSAKVSVASPPRKSVPLDIAEPSAKPYAQQLMLAHAHPRLCCQPGGCSPPPPTHHHRHRHRTKNHHALVPPTPPFPQPHLPPPAHVLHCLYAQPHRRRISSLHTYAEPILSFTLSYPPPPPRPRLPSPPPRTRTHTPTKPHVNCPRACYTLEVPSPLLTTAPRCADDFAPRELPLRIAAVFSPTQAGIEPTRAHSVALAARRFRSLGEA